MKSMWLKALDYLWKGRTDVSEEKIWPIFQKISFFIFLNLKKNGLLFFIFFKKKKKKKR